MRGGIAHFPALGSGTTTGTGTGTFAGGLTPEIGPNSADLG